MNEGKLLKNSRDAISSMDNVILNKTQSVLRCLARIRELYQDSPEVLNDQTTQDAIVLNIQRACEQAIDLAMHVVKTKTSEVPQNSREAFDLLAKARLIELALAIRMKKMVGFRNIAIHEYQKIDNSILQSIIEKNSVDFEEFVNSFKVLI